MQAVENETVNYKLSEVYQGKLEITTDWRRKNPNQPQILLKH